MILDLGIHSSLSSSSFPWKTPEIQQSSIEELKLLSQQSIGQHK